MGGRVVADPPNNLPAGQ